MYDQHGGLVVCCRTSQGEILVRSGLVLESSIESSQQMLRLAFGLFTIFDDEGARSKTAEGTVQGCSKGQQECLASYGIAPEFWAHGCLITPL